MAITVIDTSTGTELSVRDVTRELTRQDEAEYLPCPWGEQIEADLGRTFAAWSGQLDSFAADIRAVLAEYQREPEPVEFVDLPPDPALALAPDLLDAEQAARDERREKLRRQKVLKGAVDRTPVPPAKPFVPKVPWRIRIKRAVMAVLQRDAEERAL